MIKAGVYRSTRQTCAVKLLSEDLLDRHFFENFVDRDVWAFLLRMTQQEPHPHVVKYLDFFMGSSILYAVMESLDGPELFDYLTEHAPITLEFSRIITFQALSALQHIHNTCEMGLIHRDVKLENLRFRHVNTMEVVLLDFGLCCPASPQEERSVVGTPLYMAPELFSQNYTTQVDVWSTGVVLYVMLTGKPPWRQNPKRLFFSSKDGGAGALQKALDAPELKAIPEEAASLVKALLVMDPHERLNSTSALRHAWLARGVRFSGDATVSPDGQVLTADTSTFRDTAIYGKALPAITSFADFKSETSDGSTRDLGLGTALRRRLTRDLRSLSRALQPVALCCSKYTCNFQSRV